MKFFYFILLVLILYGCQPKDELKFANFNKETTLTKDVQKKYILKKIMDEDLASTNENPSTTKVNIFSKEEMISNLYKSFKSDLYTSRLIIKKSKKIVIRVKPKQTINFDYKKINRNKTLESYNFYFKIKNNISPLQITAYSNYHIKLIEKLFYTELKKRNKIIKEKDDDNFQIIKKIDIKIAYYIERRAKLSKGGYNYIPKEMWEWQPYFDIDKKLLPKIKR